MTRTSTPLLLAIFFAVATASACATDGAAREAPEQAAAAATGPAKPEGPCQNVVDSLVPVGGNENVSAVAQDDAELIAARAQAQQTLPLFLAVLDEPGAAVGLTVKAPFAEGDVVEHMWIAKPELDGELLVGTLDNDPAELTSVVAGQAVRISKRDVEDWMYTRDNLLHGGFTLRVILSRMDRERCEQVLESFDVAGFGPWDPTD